jgi:hypothetical protein
MPIHRRKPGSSESASHKAVLRVRAEGLELPRKPDEGAPRLPRELSEISDRKLMSLFAEYTEWSSFLGTKVALAEIDETEKDNIYGDMRAAHMVRNWGGGKDDRVALSKAQSDTNPEVQQARDAYEEARAYRKMVGRFYDNMTSEAAVLSREITRRVGREPGERRTGRWTP